MRGLYFPDFKLNSYGVNCKLKANKLSDEMMIYHNFVRSQYDENEWVFEQHLYASIYLRVKIYSDDRQFRIDVYDLHTLGIYDYQYNLSILKTHYKSVVIKREVDYWIEYLSEAGIIECYEWGMYI